jgi:hypothetical protein
VKISHAALMHELNQIIIQESERQNKLQYKTPVSQISPTCTPLEINTVKEAVKNDLASEMKSLRLDVTKLKEMVEQNPSRHANYSDFGRACPILNLKLRCPISPSKISDFLSYLNINKRKKNGRLRR